MSDSTRWPISGALVRSNGFDEDTPGQGLTDITYRQLTDADDIDAITALLHEAYAPLAASGMRFVASHQNSETTKRRLAKGDTFVATHDGRIVGIVTLADADATSGTPFYDRPDVADFGQFAVHPSYQRRGIGSTLMALVEARAREKGVVELALNTSEHAHDLIAMYTRKGYRFIEYTQWPDVKYRSMVFSKTLSNARTRDTLEEIRRRRIREYLPEAMANAGVDLYVVFTREGAPDPMSSELGLGRLGGRAAGLFRVAATGDLQRTAIVAKPYQQRVEATGCFDVTHGYGQEGIDLQLAQSFRACSPRRIAVNASRDLAVADGLTTGMREHLMEIIGRELSRPLVSSTSIVLSILGRKFPEEIATIESAIIATQAALTEVLSQSIIRPGTTARSVGDAIDAEARNRGMQVAFKTIRIGSRSQSGASPEEAIHPGDLVTIDCGFENAGYFSDIQRTGYVLRNSETAAPDDLQSMWEATLAAQEAAVLALRPDSTGLQVDTAARAVVQGAGFKEFPHATGHSLGRRVHDVGPILGPAWPGYGSLVHSRIESGQVFAIEPMVYAHAPSQGGEIRMGLEENVVVEASGPRLLGTPQRHLILI